MDRLEDDPLLSAHYPLVLLQNELFGAFAVQLRVVVLFLVELLLDVPDQQVLAEPGVEKVLLSLGVHYLVVAG